MRIIKLDLAGNGFFVLQESTCPLKNGQDEETVWLCQPPRTPTNEAIADGYIRRYLRQWPDAEVIEHCDFYGRLPFPGRVV